MRFERHARTRFISSKSTLVNFQQGWKNKPQVAMKLPDFCLTPLKSICFQSCCIHRQIHPLGCWDPRAWSVYQFKRPTYACAKNDALLCLFISFSLNKQNAIWTSRTNAIYQFKKHLGKLPAGLEEQAASSDETTGLLPDTVKVYLLSKLLYPPPNPSVRLLGSQGLKRLSVQTPNVRRLRQNRSNFVSMSFWLERR